MQTFLPWANFEESARALDNKRLGKQRVEAKQILNALQGRSKGWTNHPATKMWAGYEIALCAYGLAICGEWLDRGYKDSLYDEFVFELTNLQGGLLKPLIFDYPPWFGDASFHLSHRSNLLRKDPEYYGSKFTHTPDDLPYVWPTKEETNV